MSRWWVWAVGAMFQAALVLPLVAATPARSHKSTATPASSATRDTAATPAKTAPAVFATAQVTAEIRASLLKDYQISVTVMPHKGDAWTRLAKRVTADADNWEELARINDADDTLRTDRPVRVPFALLRPELQRQVMTALFPADRLTDRGWTHVIVGTGVEGESLWNIAEWLTGDGAKFSIIRKANQNQGLSTHKGDTILVPKILLTAAFGGGGAEGRNEPTVSQARKPADDSTQRTPAHADVPEAAVEAPAGGQPSLTYDREAAEPYAVYRLRKGEALYSSVAVRFTGRVYAKDVGDVVERIVAVNKIEDVARIRAGFAVKIPMDLLLPEYRPPGDPMRVEHEAAKRESSKMAVRVEARNLAGVRVILDAGHGGRDVGTTHQGVWESSYVYDVMCRLKRILEKRSAATVLATTMSKAGGYLVADSDVPVGRTDHIVLTTPMYSLDDPVVGVNLRWYLANSIFHRAIRDGVPKEKVLFISIHADSIHPSLRGAMAYIPGERYVRGSFTKSGDVYLARAEVRESPVINHSKYESLTAEGLSRDLAESVIDAFTSAGLKAHPYDPIREYVVRDGREWVPAVIRYNMVPTRLLLEVCNLGNEKDLALMRTKKYRQRVAQAIYDGIVSFYADREPPMPAGVVARAAK
ncbi:MAG TPA: N-acetylmuramoyl-L-alanine amidase [Thermoanaerobaculia bacterium]|nr:N-acetylmuramoyl-L-alanine amidase [Thermoanaerobaculia bacterium]